MTNETKLILEKLDKIESDITSIKQALDEDLELSPDDRLSIEEARNDLKQGKTRRL